MSKKYCRCNNSICNTEHFDMFQQSDKLKNNVYSLHKHLSSTYRNQTVIALGYKYFALCIMLNLNKST